MVFYSGRGWVGFVALIVFGIPLQWWAEVKLGVPYATWPLSITFALAGLLCWWCGRAWKEDGAHTLFFVPLEYWGPLFWLGALLNLVVHFAIFPHA